MTKAKPMQKNTYVNQFKSEYYHQVAIKATK